jgi:HD-GYP domain-containing protein (c-di-GMP phosphodiesterase class II)
MEKMMQDQKMARVPKVKFLQPILLPYDLYLRLAQNHFLKIARAGTVSTVHSAKYFSSADVNFIYLSSVDYPIYVNQSMSQALIDIMSASDFLDIAVTTESSLFALGEYLKTEGLTKKSFVNVEQAACVVQRAAETLTKLYPLYEQLKKMSEEQTKHSLTLAIIISMLADKFNLSFKAKEDLIIAALLHDLGWAVFSDDMKSKNRESLSQQDRLVYEEHPKVAYDLIASCEGINLNIADYVFCHHENLLGTGYPRRLNSEQLSFEALLLSFAERFVELTVGDSMHAQKFSPSEALAAIYSAKNKPYPEKILDTMSELIRP